ncbi:hypothetical protein UU7_09610 [Rhodanobacter spathiphylli B39]|uniref:Uncharacterized protein n=2 Tax=Rhodanobacter TaxID=75309 RepID=I4W193_9GAMM|nr:hypothetical protein UU7_09610 [Rhodanobacter spathiphylli B39]
MVTAGQPRRMPAGIDGSTRTRLAAGLTVDVLLVFAQLAVALFPVGGVLLRDIVVVAVAVAMPVVSKRPTMSALSCRKLHLARGCIKKG